MADELPEISCYHCAGTLIAGPRGGMAVNMACPDCHREWNVAVWRGAHFLIAAMGPLSAARARLYGIEPQ